MWHDEWPKSYKIMAHRIRSVTPRNITNPFPSPHGPRPGNCWCKRLGIKSSCAQKAELDSVVAHVQAGGHRQGATDRSMVEDERMKGWKVIGFRLYALSRHAMRMPGFSLKSMHEIQAEQRGLLIEKNEHQLGNTTKASLKFVKKPARTVQNSVVVLSKKSRQVLLLLASGKRCLYTKDFGFSLKYTRWRQEHSDKNLLLQWTP